MVGFGLSTTGFFVDFCCFKVLLQLIFNSKKLKATKENIKIVMFTNISYKIYLPLKYI